MKGIYIYHMPVIMGFVLKLREDAMLIEIFYDGETDKKTPELAEDIRYRYGAKVDVRLIDTSEEPVPQKYGIINPPVVVLGGDRIIKIEGPNSLENIVTKAIF